MMGFLSLIPLKDWIYIGAFVALSVGFGLFVHHERSVGAAHVEAIRAAEHAQAAAVAASAIAANQVETSRREAAIQEVVHATNENAARAAADAASAADAAGRLRQRLAALGRAAAIHPAASDPGPAASAPDDVRDVVLARVLDAARLASAYADSAHIAGQACERSYDTLKVTP